MQFFSIILVAVLLLCGPYYVYGANCEASIKEGLAGMTKACNDGKTPDDFSIISSTNNGPGAEITKACLDQEGAKSHGKCEKFGALEKCLIEKNLCSKIAA
uniref:LolSALOb n=1 Tax=Bichromomyia olmeca TaxID=715919 RepID=A0A1B1V3E2_9DIPT|nr:LolSALOb [Bichromomyia olmeca]